MKLDWVTVGAFQENCYLLAADSGSGVLVDPGAEPTRILGMVDAAGVNVDAIWLTHGHLDHIGAVEALRRELNVPVLLHDSDLPLYRRAAQQAANYGLPFEQPSDPDGSLSDGDELNVGGERFTVRHTPGHAPGHVIFVGQRLVVGGDLLFAGSVGRTDLPLSDPEAMERSLVLVASLDPDLVVYPGHGPPTSIGAELATNPYLNHALHART